MEKKKSKSITVNRDDYWRFPASCNGLTATASSLDPLITVGPGNTSWTQNGINTGINEISYNSDYKEKYEKLLEKLEGKKTQSILSKKEILDNILEILSVFQTKFKKFGRPVCAGGAVRDLILGDETIQPKDYDIFFICGERVNESKILDLRQKLFSEIEKLCEKEEKTKFSFDSEPIENLYGDGNLYPVANILFKKNLKVQVMYRPEIIGESDLVESFDWNFSSACISLCKNGLCLNVSPKFPGRAKALLDDETSGFFKDSKEFITALSIFEKKSEKIFAIVKNKKAISLCLNDEEGFQTQGKNYYACCYYSLHRAINFILKYKNIFDCKIRNKSLYKISKNIVNLQKLAK